MMEKCPHLKCSRWNVDGVCFSGRRSRCLRVRLERGDSFPVRDGLFEHDQIAWATEVMRLWRKAGWPTLVGGNAPEQAKLARGILGLDGSNDCKEVRKMFSWASQKRVNLSYSIETGLARGSSRSKPRSELLIHNLRKGA